MAVEPQTEPLPVSPPERDPTPEPPPATPPRRRRRAIPVSDAQVTRLVADLEQALRDRTAWAEQRLETWAKFEGLTEPKTSPWANCADVHLPILKEKVLGVAADLHNAVLSLRPLVQATAQAPVHTAKAQQITDVLDWQTFEATDGETFFDLSTDQFVQEGNAAALTYWARDVRPIVEVKRLPSDPDVPRLLQVEAAIRSGFVVDSSRLVTFEARDADGDSWALTVREGESATAIWPLEVYDLDSGDLELVLEATRTSFEGPVSVLYDLDDVVVPAGSQNVDPITAQNPRGAPWVATLERVHVDTLKRLKAQGVYDRLTAAALDAILTRATAREDRADPQATDRVQTAKADAAGTTDSPGGGASHEWVTVVQWFGGLDVNNDGLLEEVVVWVVRETQTPLRAKYLSEILPGRPLARPIAWEPFIPVRGQVYGLGLPQLLEGLHDMVHQLANLNIDSGALANMLFGFYRAASQLKPEAIRVEPGLLIPTDDPARDVNIPVLPQRDQSWNFNWLGMLFQLADKLSAVGPLQQGQVPQGKASALRTVGTTLAILQQGAARPQQILRRFFRFVRTVYEHKHRLNTRFLPPETVYRIVGRSAEDEDGYGLIAQASDLDVPVLFGFEASLVKANRGLVAEALEALGPVLVNPVMLQSGLVGHEQIFNWARDSIRAQELDDRRYLKRPPEAPTGPRISAEDVMTLVLEGLPIPTGAQPYEPVEVHLQLLATYAQQPEVAAAGPEAQATLQQWVARLQAMQAQQQALLAAAGQAQAMLATGRRGPGAPPGLGQAPPMQTETPSPAEVNNQPEGP